ncbi:2,5-didehydrogluconate reductase DkgB [Paraglaciecola sp. L1A13]|uniref:2,5-didehydrogluconate reductase DkgB n=1 Tax=Paraglaciecola sp. L1A13 TaxID=2686359 RepID=UPI00131C5F94|nr:2,5-didehydrogluconate reductase DkgB [Paraglaciecola sp. L1A13]|tara:strand:+ start:1127 stop:1933 length:807 start_codon:yes stop_codon:yes gene_type:complete
MHNFSLPTPGFGTYRLEDDEAKSAVANALDVGYRHIDTAQIYENEAEVGDAIAGSGLKRDEIFLTTKVWFENLSSAKFITSVQNSLTLLNTDYVDLLLIHWPSPDNKVPMSEYLKELKGCKERGLTKHIGVSNFTQSQLDEALAILGKDQILTNQIEVHPNFQNTELVQYCQRNNIQVTAYMPLGVGKVMESDVLQAIAHEHDTTPSAVALAWLNHKKIVAIPSSTNVEHMRDNLTAKQLMLTADEIVKIDAIEPQERIVDPDFAPDW